MSDAMKKTHKEHVELFESMVTSWLENYRVDVDIAIKNSRASYEQAAYHQRWPISSEEMDAVVADVRAKLLR